MEQQPVTAKLSYLRQGPRKVRLVADLIRGRKVTIAERLLALNSKKAARPLLKLLNSAVANAKHNAGWEKESLKISKIIVNEGAVLKRWMPRAHGRAGAIRERTSHISLELLPIIKKEKKESGKPTEKVAKKKSNKK